MNRGADINDVASLRALILQLVERMKATGRDYPVPQLSAK